jgi:hypothetical protein
MRCVAVLVTSMLVAACSGSIERVTGTVPTTETTSTTVPGPMRGVVPEEAWLPLGSVEGADYLFVSAAVSLEDVVHAYIIGFREEQSEVMVMSWEEDPSEMTTADPEVDELELDLRHPGPMPISVTQLPDGSWVMYGFGVPTSPGATPVFWRAISDSPTGPWDEASIVYEIGGPGAWDGAWIDFPTVFQSAAGLSMLYEGASDAPPEIVHLGVAASPDGITWERPEAPSLSPQDCDDTISIRMPRLLPLEEDWLFAFIGVPGRNEEPPIRVAAGQDPQHPSCDDAEVALRAEDLPSSGGIHSYALARAESGSVLLVESLEGATGSSVWLIPLEPVT